MTMLLTKKIELEEDFVAAEKLFRDSFPREERIPFGFLKMRSAYDDIDFTAYCDENNFVGMSYVMKFKSLAFIFYLAVERNFRSKGYGSEILQIIKKNCEGKTLLLDIEFPSKTAKNFEQRERRKNFYLRNGYEETKKHFEWNGVLYEILQNGDAFNMKDYKQMIKNFSYKGLAEEFTDENLRRH